eukprot:CAMPEP_0113682488 /NCGR_PEP_ID=MMETSP0038_2-20120614/12694_1 /TAXON_ID=2898 /ORGANISM="Cryptomonas paramecium" /LENGTH=283 /DNA_ID=CAMNT_0000601569 /DNA_START=35 /DNA_END=886 /DNA_ORIENTATION=+ /assembly_acc=CAM_ASM_000170
MSDDVDGAANEQAQSRFLQWHENNERAAGFAPIVDQYKTIEEVQDGLRKAGLESSNLIVAVDFTKSNTWTGKSSFGGRCLHDLSGGRNPYQEVISIVGRTLEAFDDDNLIPTYGFGDIYTTNKSCFPFFPDRPCNGLGEVLSRYIQICPGVQLSGPTNFAPVIDTAINTVSDTGSYHILIIIADGQVTNKAETVEAIVRASSYPLSIVMVGVGDGPWDMMKEFDDELPQRRFDNFQFVCYTDLHRQFAGSGRTSTEEDAAMAMSMLMEIPEQYKAIQKLGILK